MSFIVIEGLDGAGKSTQIEKLCDELDSLNLQYEYIHFPRTQSPVFGELIARFLRGEFGNIHEVDPYLVALIYAGDRMDAAAGLQKSLDQGKFVLLDRYVYSNIAYQCAKIPNASEREKLKDWILNLEYSYFKIPKPRINIFLDVPFRFTENNLSVSRKGKDRDYLNGRLDIHENDLQFQKKVHHILRKNQNVLFCSNSQHQFFYTLIKLKI